MAPGQQDAPSRVADLLRTAEEPRHEASEAARGAVHREKLDETEFDAHGRFYFQDSASLAFLAEPAPFLLCRPCLHYLGLDH